MKSARELFEEPGYKLKYKNKYEIMYIKPDVLLNKVYNILQGVDNE